ncbi:MAG: DNA polymerase III subunit epsilon [Pseudomonadota bacterium]
MREIVLDTETTGLDPATGDRIIEIGAVELFNHLPTGESFHRYLNPDRSVSDGAVAVHGLTDAFLADKPRFAEVADDFLSFIGEAKLVIHNAAFDMGFLNAELARLDRTPLRDEQAIDTLEIARRRYPGARNSLDALCARFGVDNSAREKHGALLDAEILAHVYLELVGGRQPGLELASNRGTTVSTSSNPGDWQPPVRPRALPERLTAEERAAHAAMLAELGTPSTWPPES